MFTQIFAIVFVIITDRVQAENFAAKLTTFKNETVSAACEFHMQMYDQILEINGMFMSEIV